MTHKVKNEFPLKSRKNNIISQIDAKTFVFADVHRVLVVRLSQLQYKFLQHISEKTVAEKVIRNFSNFLS